MYRIRQIPAHKRALLRESNPREIALSLRRARRFPRNLVSTIQPDMVRASHKNTTYSHEFVAAASAGASVALHG